MRGRVLGVEAPRVDDAGIVEARAGVDTPPLRGDTEQCKGREDRDNNQEHLGHLRDLVQFTRPIEIVLGLARYVNRDFRRNG